MQYELILGLGALAVYAFLPSKLKRSLGVNIAILAPLAVLIIWSQLTSGYTWPQMGIRTDGWTTGALPVALFAANAAMLLVGIAVAKKRFTLNRNMLFAALVYPLWGIAQQFLILSFINVRLMDLHWPGVLIALVSAVAYMLLHYPDRWLMPATVVLGFAFSLLFQLEPNLIALGITHAWLGILYYYWIMGKDPIAEKLPGVHRWLHSFGRG